MSKFIDFTGQRFGKLVVVGASENKRWRSKWWICKCDCGREHEVVSSSLKNGNTTSCTKCLENIWTFSGNVAECEISRKSGNKITFTIDIDDYERVSKHNWNVGSGNYIKSWINKKYIKLHRFIMNAPDGMNVDHINHNKLDNRKSQLRVCTFEQNLMNQKKYKNNSSGYKGVSWHKNKKWVAQIQINGKRKNLGYFETKEDAAEAYNEAAKNIYKEFANLNKIK